MIKYIMTIRLKEVGLKKYFEFEFGEFGGFKGK